MVPIFAFISPTFIYSFLEEKVQSSNNYLICVGFLLYAREINTKEISSVVLDCECYLKMQPISPVSLHEVQEIHLWGKNQHCSQFQWGGWAVWLEIHKAELAARTGRFPGAAPGLSSTHCNICWSTNSTQDRALCLLFHTGVQIKAELARVKGYETPH